MAPFFGPPGSCVHCFLSIFPGAHFPPVFRQQKSSFDCLDQDSGCVRKLIALYTDLLYRVFLLFTSSSISNIGFDFDAVGWQWRSKAPRVPGSNKSHVHPSIYPFYLNQPTPRRPWMVGWRDFYKVA